MASPSLPALSFGSKTVTLVGVLMSNILDGIYDALTATTYDDGTSVPAAAQWQVTKYQNTGLTEAVYAEPAASSPAAGKVVLIWAAAASGTHSSVVAASPHTYANGSVMFGAYVASAGGTISRSNFSSWDGATPFTAGGRFTGYCRLYASTTAAKVFLFSSAEYIALQLEEAAGGMYACAGGFGVRGVSDHSTSSESGLGGRVFDFGTNGTALAALHANFWTVSLSGGSSILSHSTTANFPAWWYLTPGSSTIRPVSYRGVGSTAADGFQVSSAVACVGLNAEVEPEPIAMRDVGSGGNVNRKIGRHRAFFFSPKRKTKAILSSGATKKWIAFGQSVTSDNDCALMPIA